MDAICQWQWSKLQQKLVVSHWISNNYNHITGKGPTVQAFNIFLVWMHELDKLGKTIQPEPGPI